MFCISSISPQKFFHFLVFYYGSITPSTVNSRTEPTRLSRGSRACFSPRGAPVATVSGWTPQASSSATGVATGLPRGRARAV